MYVIPDSPEVQHIPAQKVREGETVTLTCISRGNPQPNSSHYVWTTVGGGAVRTQNLTIVAANKNDTGEYTCTVEVTSKGGYGKLEGSIKTRLTIQCK